MFQHRDWVKQWNSWKSGQEHMATSVLIESISHTQIYLFIKADRNLYA